MAPLWKENFSLKQLNTFGFDARARRFTELQKREDLDAFFERGRAPALLLGAGSNVLLLREEYEEVALNSLKGKRLLDENEDSVLLAVASGEIWHELVLQTLQQAWYGLENLSLIPGTVGAAPIQNIGAYGVELESVLEAVLAREWSTGELRRFSREECQLGYRDSFFKQAGKGRYFIEEVVLRLSKRPDVNLSYGALRQMLERQGVSEPSPQDVSRAVIEIRQSKLPAPEQIGNAGSFFKNPVLSGLAAQHWLELFSEAPHYVLEFDEEGCPLTIKIPAAWLIEQCGWKGRRRGAVGVHERQALVLVHYGGGKARELLALSEEIQQSVYERFGLQLEREVNVERCAF